MGKKRRQSEKPTDTLRRLIEGSSDSIRAIAKAAGVDNGNLSRFVSDEAVSMDAATLDKLAAYFGLELREKK